jgi:hypothetical protein
MPEKAKELEQVWLKQTNDFTELSKKTLSEQPQAKAKGKGKGKGKKK